VQINAGLPRPSKPASLQDILALGLTQQANDGLAVQFLQDKPALFEDKGMV